MGCGGTHLAASIGIATGRASSIRIATALAATLFVWAIGLSAAYAEDAEVKIDNFTFAPQHLTVKSGTTVTWTNEDDIPHTVAASSKAFKSKALDTDDRFSFTFTTPGTYEYFCALHPHMTGSIVVEAQTGENATR
jgi:amicyanin